MRTSTLGRRAALGGVLAISLTACSRRSDVPTVTTALQEAVESVPEYRDGTVGYQDSFSAGTTINGVLAVAGQDRAALVDGLTVLLETVIRTYAEQPGVREAFVRIRVHPEGHAGPVVTSEDVVEPAEGANVTTDDLINHFGI